MAISSVLLFPKRIMDRKQRQGLRSKTKSQQYPAQQVLESEPDVELQPVLESQLQPETPPLRKLIKPRGHFGLSNDARVTLCHLYRVFSYFAYKRPDLKLDTIIFAHEPRHWQHGTHLILNIRNPRHPSLPHDGFFMNYNLLAVDWNIDKMSNYYTHLRRLNHDQIYWHFYEEDVASSCCVPDYKVDVILSKNEIIDLTSLDNLRNRL